VVRVGRAPHAEFEEAEGGPAAQRRQTEAVALGDGQALLGRPVGDLDPAQQRCDLGSGAEGFADQPLLSSRLQVALLGIECCPLEVAGPDLDPRQAPGQILAPVVVSSLAGLL
jgi:hypothetical protein